ncbi:MAG: hypothetical protein KGS45_02430 [Planctomycetes bacterium]|nr:hypothetical protein [Planctomycetota bacterium]
MTRTIRTATLLALTALTSTAPAFYDVYPDRVSLLRGVRGDAFSHTYRSFTGQYSSSPYSRTLNGWNVDVTTPIGGTTALFLTNNGIGAASSLTSTFISTGPRLATAAAMKVFVLNIQ